MTKASRMPQAMSKHRVQSPGQNTLETGPLQFMTPARFVLWAGGMASTSFIPFLPSHCQGQPTTKHLPPILPFNPGTNMRIPVARHRIGYDSIQPKHSNRLGPSITTRTGFRPLRSHETLYPTLPKARVGRTESGLALEPSRLRLGKVVMWVVMTTRSLAVLRSKRGNGGL